MKHHELKTDPEVFSSAWAGFKTYEIRLNDRRFEVGDQVTLRETVFTRREMEAGVYPLEYTGRALGREITEVRTGYGLKDGYCALGLKGV